MTPDFPDKPLSAKAQRRLATVTTRLYRLQSDEDPAEGVRRVARGRVEAAVEQLRRHAQVDRADAVHDTRKDMKKLRSLLRLVRDELGDARYQSENERYRDAARLLSGPRDAEVKLATLADLRERYPDEAPALERLTGELEKERDQLAGGDEGLDARLEEAAEAISAGEAEVDGWRFAHGDFELVRPGLERAYRRGRDRYRDVRDDPSDEAVHEWRKRVKDLWYDLRVLRNAWPGAMKATADEAHHLSDLLGDHHDLAVLTETANASAPDDPEVATLEQLARRRQDELLADALPLGERLYAEKPKRFSARLATYWHAWRPNGD